MVCAIVKCTNISSQLVFLQIQPAPLLMFIQTPATSFKYGATVTVLVRLTGGPSARAYLHAASLWMPTSRAIP